jgi:zona occludens toxin (predicted ATPase)
VTYKAKVQKKNKKKKSASPKHSHKKVSAQDKKEGKAVLQTTEISFLFSYLSLSMIGVKWQLRV